MGRRYVVEGEAGAKTVALRLKKKKWTLAEVKDADEKQLEFTLPGLQGNQALPVVQQKLLPRGEGWSRHSDDMLVHSQSQIFFVQIGDKAGQYMRRSVCGQSWEDVDEPHNPQEHPVLLRTASASCVRRGGKLDRAVLLNDITKIARLACKIPLGFVDKPACACALFQGLRSAESAQWCAENAHKKLLPRLADKIHLHTSEELESLLRKTLEELDAELLASPHAFSGCSALIVLLLGDRLTAAGVGQVRAVVLPEGGAPEPLLSGGPAPGEAAERDRILKAGGVVRDGVVHGQLDDLDDAMRVLSARHVFDILMVDMDGPLDEKQVRSSYRKLALRVHPDKQAEGADNESFSRAFARLESATQALEAMVSEDPAACRELCRVLRSSVHTRAGAAELLGVDKAATTDTEVVAKEAEKASAALIRRLAKLQLVAPDYQDAVAMCQEAVETLRRGCAPEALPRQEALLREGIECGRAMGVRDLRKPRPIVTMEPATASWRVPVGKRFRVALLCGATAALPDEALVKATARHVRQPKASALRWCLDALEANASSASSTSICLALGSTKEEAGPPAKKAKVSTAGPEGTVRIRHILLRHQQLRPDPMARREGGAKTAQEAEEAALRALETLQQGPNQFLQLCRSLSDCQSAAQPGTLSGDLGWIAIGQQEQIIDDAVFSLGVNEFSDIVSSSRGVHIIQRLA